MLSNLAHSHSAVFWETSVPWEWSEGRSKRAGWTTKEERWGRGPSKLVHPRKPQKQKQGKQRPGTPVQIAGLPAYYLELVSMDLEHLWPFWLPWPLLKDPPCSYQNGPFWSFTLDLWFYGLILFSVVAECNVCTVNHLFCHLSWRKKKICTSV